MTDSGIMVAMAVKALAGNEEVPLVRKGDEWLLRFDAIRIVQDPMGGAQVVFAWKGVVLPIKANTDAVVKSSRDHNHLTNRDTLTITGLEGFTKAHFGENEKGGF